MKKKRKQYNTKDYRNDRRLVVYMPPYLKETVLEAADNENSSASEIVSAIVNGFFYGR